MRKFFAIVAAITILLSLTGCQESRSAQKIYLRVSP